MAFKSKLSEEGGVLTVSLSGSLDALSIDDFKIVLNEVMKTGRKKILLIMKNLTFINSSAIGAFLSFHKWVSGVGGVLKIAEVHPRAMQVFKMMLHLNITCSKSQGFHKFPPPWGERVRMRGQ